MKETELELAKKTAIKMIDEFSIDFLENRELGRTQSIICVNRILWIELLPNSEYYFYMLVKQELIQLAK